MCIGEHVMSYNTHYTTALGNATFVLVQRCHVGVNFSFSAKVEPGAKYQVYVFCDLICFIKHVSITTGVTFHS